jgi:alpha-D-xyloside xylohydrolase
VLMGPPIEYAQLSEDLIELRVYTGADGDFTLYQDDGNTYDYEKGAHSTIAIHWDDASRTLTAAERKGHFSGVPSLLKFHVVLVGKNHGAAEAVTENPDAILNHTGAAVRWKP